MIETDKSEFEDTEFEDTSTDGENSESENSEAPEIDHTKIGSLVHFVNRGEHQAAIIVGITDEKESRVNLYVFPNSLATPMFRDDVAYSLENNHMGRLPDHTYHLVDEEGPAVATVDARNDQPMAPPSGTAKDGNYSGPDFEGATDEEKRAHAKELAESAPFRKRKVPVDTTKKPDSAAFKGEAKVKANPNQEVAPAYPSDPNAPRTLPGEAQRSDSPFPPELQSVTPITDTNKVPNQPHTPATDASQAETVDSEVHNQ